ncbi:MAG: BON domain-containing protein [Chloroflexi bacterium]|nr:BON domain-containing protein [Chloroflexota bacterium]
MSPREARIDAGIQCNVLRALSEDVRLDVADAHAEVIQGTVYLRGKAPSLFQKCTAEEIVERVRGVLAVVNEIEVDLPQSRSDGEITIEVKGALSRDSWVHANQIEVTTLDGHVYLAGVAQSYVEKTAAEEDATVIRGVREVINGIVVVPAEIKTDEEITGDVRIALFENLLLGRSEIEVEVRNQIVHLRGSVSSVDVYNRIEDLAKATTGVVDVINEITIED